MDPRPRRRRITVALALVVVAGGLAAARAAGAFRLFGPRPPSTILRLSGNVEAHESALAFKIAGRIARIAVDEGATVEAGATLATLEDDDARAQLALDESTLRAREAELRLVRAGTRRQELHVAEQAIVDAEADLALRRSEVERVTKLLRADAATQQQFDAATALLRHAEAIAERARQLHDEAQQGNRREQIAVTEALVEQARQVVAISRLRLAHTELRAPTRGVVLSRPAEAGEVAQPGTPILIVGDLARPWVRVYVDEPDLGRLRHGQPATLRTDGGQTLAGRVSFIASEAEFTPKSVETHKERVTLVYRVKVDVDNAAGVLKPGMPVDVELPIEAPR